MAKRPRYALAVIQPRSKRSEHAVTPLCRCNRVVIARPSHAVSLRASGEPFSPEAENAPESLHRKNDAGSDGAVPADPVIISAEQIDQGLFGAISRQQKADPKSPWGRSQPRISLLATSLIRLRR
jgi:hypothetical protein